MSKTKLDNHYQINEGGGLTKREYFAIMAMNGLLSLNNNAFYGDVVHDAISCADRLIEELNKSDEIL